MEKCRIQKSFMKIIKKGMTICTCFFFVTNNNNNKKNTKTESSHTVCFHFLYSVFDSAREHEKNII